MFPLHHGSNLEWSEDVGGNHPVFHRAVSMATSGDLAIAINLTDRSVSSEWSLACLFFCQTASSTQTLQGTWILQMPLEPALPQASCVFLQSWADKSTEVQRTCAE